MKRRLPILGPCVLTVLALSILFLAASGAFAGFDGDGKSDIAVYRPSIGAWFALRSSNGVVKQESWGIPGDILVPGDYDGDGNTDVAVFRAGLWFVIRSTDQVVTTIGWGVAGDIPAPGDYDGDGKTDVAVFRPVDGIGMWYILRSSDGGITQNSWGIDGDIPVQVDFDGDGKTDIAVYRPSIGGWFGLRSSNGVVKQESWGIPGDILVPGDYDGDGNTDVAVFRPSAGLWFIIRSTDQVVTTIGWGVNGDLPAPGDYDGDGKTDVAVFRPVDGIGMWYILRSSDGGITQNSWGIQGDEPVKVTVGAGDLGAIRLRLNQLQALINDNTATPQTLDPFISADFLDDGSTKAAEIASWTTGGDGPQPGGSFTDVRIVEVLNPSPKTVKVFCTYNHPSGAETIDLVLRREGTAWRLYGNQRIMNLEVKSKLLREIYPPPTPPGTLNGLYFQADDSNGAGAAVQSIVVTGPGIPPPGITMIRGTSYFYYPAAQYGVYNISSDGVIGAIPDNAAYTFNLYSGPNGSGSLLYAYSVVNPKRPYLWSEINDSLFPQMISPTSHALSAANPGGFLVPMYTIPAGHSANWAHLSFQDGTGGWWDNDLEARNIPTYAFNSAGMGFTPTEGRLELYTRDATAYRDVGIGWRFQSPAAPFSIQIPDGGAGNHLYLRENTDGTKGYWHDVAVRNADGSLLTNAALIQDFRCFSYPAMTPIPPSGPWFLWQSAYYFDNDGNGPNPPSSSPYSGIDGYLDVPVGTLSTGFTLCAVTDTTGQQQIAWLYHTAPTEVPKVQSASMGMVDNGDGTVTLSWTPPAMPPLDPAKHFLRVYVNSSIDYSGDGFHDLIFLAHLTGTASSYTIPASEVTRLGDFSSLYWYVQTRERAFNVTDPGGSTRNYWTYRNNGHTLPLTLP